MAKLFASDTAMRVTTDCVQLLGGIGYTKDMPAERIHARRQDHPDLRGHEPDPADRDRKAPAVDDGCQTDDRVCGSRPRRPGFLHVGSARTALFNWLHARHAGGTFILRIEDTDVARSTRRVDRQIQQVMRWLGLDWDEGPFLQSQRFDAYLAAAERLLDAGAAYECFCTEDEVRERNEQAMRDGPAARLRRPVPRPHAERARGAREPRAGRGRFASGRPTTARARSSTSCAARYRSSGRRSPIS